MLYPKLAIVLCSYKSKNLTERAYNQLKNNKGVDVFVLENSPTIGESFLSADTILMGHENVGYGGMHDYIFADPKFREYDFVGIFNNDVYDIPPDFIDKIKPYFHSKIGMISPVFNKEGSGWPHMKRLRGDGYREVGHVEDMAAFLNTRLFPELTKYAPMQFYGILDIQLSQLYKHHGYKTIVVDDVQIGHMLAGARKVAGVLDDYMANSSKEMDRWHKQFPLVGQLYEDYMAHISKKITVVVSSYGYNHLIRRAVESALSDKADVVVVDDGSAIERTSELDGLRVRYFRHDKNRGLGSTRNTAIANTISPWILPLDSDDYLLPDAIDKLLQREEEADVFYGNLIYQHDDTKLVPTPEIKKKNFLVNNQLFGASLYRRKLWERVGGYIEDPPETYEDWLFWGMCAAKGAKFQYVNIDVYKYNGDANGMCARVSKERDKHAELIRRKIQEAL